MNYMDTNYLTSWLRKFHILPFTRHPLADLVHEEVTSPLTDRQRGAGRYCHVCGESSRTMMLVCTKINQPICRLCVSSLRCHLCHG